ncbi:MAG: AAA family ATPase, partial [bacterium]
MAITLKSTRDAAEDGQKFLVSGPPGAGKTMLCATTGEPTILISAESGLLSLRNFDIPVIEVKTLESLYEAYEYVAMTDEGRSYRWVCLDSISEIAEVVLNHERKVAKDPRQAYGALAEKMTDLIRAFRDLPGRNVYFSCKQERA